MQRRDFLKAVSAVAALPLLPSLAPADPTPVGTVLRYNRGERIVRTFFRDVAGHEKARGLVLTGSLPEAVNLWHSAVGFLIRGGHTRRQGGMWEHDRVRRTISMGGQVLKFSFCAAHRPNDVYRFGGMSLQWIDCRLPEKMGYEREYMMTRLRGFKEEWPADSRPFWYDKEQRYISSWVNDPIYGNNARIARSVG